MPSIVALLHSYARRFNLFFANRCYLCASGSWVRLIGGSGGFGAMPKMKLTKRVVEAVEPEKRDVIVWDTDLPGFGLKVTPAGKRVYFCYYRTRAGQQRRPTIGQHGVLTAEEARGIAKAMLAEVTQGEDPSQNRQEMRRAPTLAEFSERYLTDHARTKKKPLSVLADERNLSNHILPALGPRRSPTSPGLTSPFSTVPYTPRPGRPTVASCC